MPIRKPGWMHWEKWPFKLIYFPLTPVWLWYCLRSRSFWWFSSSNPTITFGGMEGEGKREMYDQLPADTYPKTIYVDPKLPESKLIEQVLQAGFSYPFVVKCKRNLCKYESRPEQYYDGITWCDFVRFTGRSQ
jgi:hypothetical protein